MKKYNRVQYEQMKAINRGNDPIITQYSHLEGVNCILILCEKGKMGTCAIYTMLRLRSLLTQALHVADVFVYWVHVL